MDRAVRAPVHADGYTDDPTGLLRFNPVSFTGKKKLDIPLADLALSLDKGAIVAADRLFIRAVARAQPRDGKTCIPDSKGGQCIWRYAFANPIWAISPPRPGGACPKDKPRAIDSDGDGIPDGCDPCPHAKGTICPVIPPQSGNVRH
jgi:hypothetical protein